VKRWVAALVLAGDVLLLQQLLTVVHFLHGLEVFIFHFKHFHLGLAWACVVAAAAILPLPVVFLLAFVLIATFFVTIIRFVAQVVDAVVAVHFN